MSSSSKEDTVGLEELRNALQSTSEIELTVTGRKSGRESPPRPPVWFVEEAEKHFLLPVGGSVATGTRTC
jgi:hypothetical protein